MIKVSWIFHFLGFTAHIIDSSCTIIGIEAVKDLVVRIDVLMTLPNQFVKYLWLC